MRRDPNLSLTHAAKLQGVKAYTVKKYLTSALKESHGKFQVTKSDRYTATLHLPDARGNSVAVKTRSSKDREALSQYLRDLGRYLRGKRDALAAWHGKKIAGVELVTDGRTTRSHRTRALRFLSVSGIQRRCGVRDQRPIRTARRRTCDNKSERARAWLFHHVFSVYRTITRQAETTIRN